MSLKSFFMKPFVSIFNKSSYEEETKFQKAFSLGYEKAKKEMKDQREEDELRNLKSFIGKKVIIISNEWQDLTVGFATGIVYITQAQQPLLEIEDVLTKQQVFTFGQVYLFDMETLNALLKLNPYERWNLRTSHAKITWDKPKNVELTDPEVFIEKLKVVGFI